MTNDYKTYAIILFLGIQVGILIVGILWAIADAFVKKELKEYTDKLKNDE